MSFPAYTRADLCARVLARLVEVGGFPSGTVPTAFGAPYTRDQIADRALARLGEIGFDLAQPYGVSGRTTDQIADAILGRLGEIGYDLATSAVQQPYTLDALVVRTLARLGESGFDLTGPDASDTVVIAVLYDRVLARLGETGFDRSSSVVPPVLARSLEDLVQRALVRLGEVGFGQAAEPEAAARMRELAPEALADLVARRVYLPIVAPIPPEAFDGLATILASRASSDFGLPGDEITLLAQRAQAAEAGLQRIVFDYQGRIRGITGETIAELSADRLLSYPVAGTIALETIEAVSAIAASRACDDFKISADRRQAFAAQETAATAKLRRLVFGFREKVEAALPGVLSELAADRIAVFPVEDQIAPEQMDAVSAIVAVRLMDDFQVPLERAQVMAGEAQAALAKLRRLALGHKTRVVGALPGLLAEFARDRLIGYPAGETVLAETADAVAALAAPRFADTFGLPPDRMQVMLAEAQAAEARLRRLAYGYQQRVSTALPGIVAELAGGRVYPFPVDGSIPAEAGDALADILSARMAGDFGLDAGTRQILAAEAEAGRQRLILLGLPSRIAAAVPAILAELYTDRVYAFPADDTIRPDAFDGLAAICSARLAMDVAPARAPILVGEAQMAEARLRRMRAQPAPSRPLRAMYF